MIPSSIFRLRSFSEYVKRSENDDVSAVRTYLLDIYKNIHSKGLCFGECQISCIEEEIPNKLPFYCTFSIEKISRPNSSFIPFQIASTFKTPPEVVEKQLYKGEKSDSWIIGMGIVEHYVGRERMDTFIQEYKAAKITLVEYLLATRISQGKPKINPKIYLILLKLLRSDFEQRFTTGEVLKLFFSYDIFPEKKIKLQPRYEAVKERLEMYLDLDRIVDENTDIKSAEFQDIEKFIKELCVAPYLEKIDQGNIFRVIFDEDSNFFVNLVLFIRVCNIYYYIMNGVFHPIKDSIELRKMLYFPINIGQIDGQDVDIYEDMKMLFKLIDSNTEQFALTEE